MRKNSSPVAAASSPFVFASTQLDTAPVPGVIAGMVILSNTSSDSLNPMRPATIPASME